VLLLDIYLVNCPYPIGKVTYYYYCHFIDYYLHI